MATAKQLSNLFLLLALVTLSSITYPSIAADDGGGGLVSVYWGQASNEEGTLLEACETGNYGIVIIEGLIVYNSGNTPTLNLRNHCGSDKQHPCSALQKDIEYCQQKNVKVILSILADDSVTPAPPPPPPPLSPPSPTPSPSPSPSPSSSSTLKDDVNVEKELADYLLNHFFSGKPGPLGNVSLDGIDIMDVPDSSNLKWDTLVHAIKASTTERNIYISVSPQCVYPDYFLDSVIQTGLVDYIWVEFFYRNPCIYANGDATNLLKAWEEWTSNVPNSLIFLGLPASEKAVSAGYIPPEVLISEVLPATKEASNYGGVMIWDRYYDKISGYSAEIKDSVPKVSTSLYGLPLHQGFLQTT